MTTYRICEIKGYHAHIYYSPKTKFKAGLIREALDANFKGKISLGRWRDEAVGPHTRAMYQVSFDNILFAEIVPWLALNRDGLTVLIHPESGDALSNHTDRAIWMGEMLRLNLDKLANANNTGAGGLNHVNKQIFEEIS